MTLLAIDTSGSICACALFDMSTQSVVCERVEDIGRGHAERLIGQIDECLSEAGIEYSDLTRIAVTIGPGSFTGVRVGMSAAKGLVISLEIPLVGISTLDALEAHARENGAASSVAVIMDAKRGQAYCRIGEDVPLLMSLDEIAQKLEGFSGTLCGSGVMLLPEEIVSRFSVAHELGVAPIACVARLAALAVPSESIVEPLYLRGADAKVQSGFALPRQEN